MEGYDRPVAGISHHIGQHLGRTQLLTVVSCDKIPHDDFIVTLQRHILHPAHMSVGWTEQIRFHHLVGLVRVGQIV